MHNSVYGKTVVINCDFTLEQKENLHIVGTNGIHIMPGFTAEEKCNLNITTNSKVHNSFENTEDQSQNTIEDAQSLEAKSFKVYPNPNKGEFFIESLNHNYEDLIITLFDSRGKTIKTIEYDFFNNPIIKIDNYSGFTMVKISNPSNHTQETHKILID
jgi:hypothetical protein